MSGAFAAHRESYRIEGTMACSFLPLDGKKCNEPAHNCMQNGHDFHGKPYLSYFCDKHEAQRP